MSADLERHSPVILERQGDLWWWSCRCTRSGLESSFQEASTQAIMHGKGLGVAGGGKLMPGKPTTKNIPDHGISSEWPFTCRCLDCDYVGWPNTTEIRERGKTVAVRQSCPRTPQHREMVRIRITAWNEVAHSVSGTTVCPELIDGSIRPPAAPDG